METEETKRIETQADQEREVVEHNDQDAGLPDPKPDSLDRKDAIREAIAKHSETERPVEKAVPEAGSEPTKAEVKEAVDNGEPPAEFSAEAKKAWKDGDSRRVIQEYDKLARERLRRMSKAETERNQAIESTKPIKDLVDQVRTYLAARGDDDLPDHVKIAQTLQLMNEMRKGAEADPEVITTELKKLGVDLSRTGGKNNSENSVLTSLQETVSALVSEREARVYEQTKGVFTEAFNTLASQKTRTGEPVFPYLLDNSDLGIQFAAELGSRTKDPQFRKWVEHRFPDADHTTLVREAYLSLGGKVSGEPVQVSASNQEHIQKSRRAAASTPGRPTSSKTSNSQIGKLDRKSAIRAAIADHRGEH